MNATMEQKIHDLMRENYIMGEVVDYNGDIRMVAVEIIWGDWKHGHLRLDWLMRENFPELRSITVCTTEEDEGDCYSAIHYYYFGL